MKRTVLALILTAGAAATAAAPTAAAAATSPSVTTDPATSLADTSAQLNGSVNPNGAATSYYFQYGPTAAYGAATGTHSAGSGTTTRGVHVTASHLVPGTAYHFRLVAVNGAGTTVGADRTFTTAGHPPPAVVTGPATYVSTDAAVVGGTINPNGDVTSWTVQYGTSTAYGVETFSGSLPATNAPVPVSITLRGLSAGTVFHYRLLARHSSSSSISYGADQQFMTYTFPKPQPSIRAHTTPRSQRTGPFTLTTTGRVAGPSWIPATYACTGQVRVRWFLGRRAIREALVPLQPTCTYSAQTVFKRRPGRAPRGHEVKLFVFARYLGTGYLASALVGHPQTVTLG